MQIVSDITKYATIFFILLIVLCAIAIAIVYYLVKVKRIASKEELFDYSKFDRKDSLDYVRFDRIINSVENNVQTKNGIIVLDEGTRFVAALKVNGYNFFTASAQEQRQSMSGMISFLNAIEGDIQYRQSTKAIDLSENIEKHKKRLNDIELEIYGLKMDHEDLVEKAEAYVNMPEIFENYHQRLLQIEKNITCKTHTQQELDVLIQYMEALSGTNLESEKVQCWLFEWKYNPNDYIEEMNDEERFKKAASELSTKTGSYMSALLRTGCSCERMSGEEILELFRYHFSPITSDVYKVNDLYDSSINHLYVTSSSLEILKAEENAEKEYNEFMKEQRAAEYASYEQELNDDGAESLESVPENIEQITIEETVDEINDEEIVEEDELFSFISAEEDDIPLKIDFDEDEDDIKAVLNEPLFESTEATELANTNETEPLDAVAVDTEPAAEPIKTGKRKKNTKNVPAKIEGRQMSLLEGISFGNGVN